MHHLLIFDNQKKGSYIIEAKNKMNMKLFSFFVVTVIFSTSIGKYILVHLGPNQQVLQARSKLSKDLGKTIKANKNQSLKFC